MDAESNQSASGEVSIEDEIIVAEPTPNASTSSRQGSHPPARTRTSRPLTASVPPTSRSRRTLLSTNHLTQYLVSQVTTLGLTVIPDSKSGTYKRSRVTISRPDGMNRCPGIHKDSTFTISLLRLSEGHAASSITPEVIIRNHACSTCTLRKQKCVYKNKSFKVLNGKLSEVNDATVLDLYTQITSSGARASAISRPSTEEEPQPIASSSTAILPTASHPLFDLTRLPIDPQPTLSADVIASSISAEPDYAQDSLNTFMGFGDPPDIDSNFNVFQYLETDAGLINGLSYQSDTLGNEDPNAQFIDPGEEGNGTWFTSFVNPEYGLDDPTCNHDGGAFVDEQPSPCLLDSQNDPREGSRPLEGMTQTDIPPPTLERPLDTAHSSVDRVDQTLNDEDAHHALVPPEDSAFDVPGEKVIDNKTTVSDSTPSPVPTSLSPPATLIPLPAISDFPDDLDDFMPPPTSANQEIFDLDQFDHFQE